MSAKITTVGILAGEGQLPVHLVNHCINNNISVCAVQFNNCDYYEWPKIPILKTRLEKVGDIFKFLNTNCVTDVVMIGNLNRPSLKSLRPDLRGIKTLGKIASSFVKGDDDLLRSLRSEIENEGFNVRGIDYFIKDLTVPVGIISKKAFHSVNKDIIIREAVDAAIQHGIADKGQSILAHNDGTYSFEGRNGTSALIEEHGRNGSILVKMIKPQQDPDLDRPTVGIHTLKMLYKKNCAGMIVEAGQVFLVDKTNMIEFANSHDLFIEAVNA